MANLPGSIKNLNTLLGEQLAEGGGGGGSSDFSTAKLTVTLPEFAAYGFNVANIKAEGSQGSSTSAYSLRDSGVYDVILYKGRCEGAVFSREGKSVALAVTGGAEDLGNGFFAITGDCTITVTFS